MMRSWSVQDAKARFSEFLDVCMAEGPQLVTKRGTEAAVLVPMAEWQRLQASSRLTMKELLLAPTPRSDVLIPARGGLRRRQPLEIL
jgi:prevent-host-death family protein